MGLWSLGTGCLSSCSRASPKRCLPVWKRKWPIKGAEDGLWTQRHNLSKLTQARLVEPLAEVSAFSHYLHFQVL